MLSLFLEHQHQKCFLGSNQSQMGKPVEASGITHASKAESGDMLKDGI